ncbi:MAG: DNA polymerase IV, partial [Actinomycetes bacterium]
AEAQRLVRLIGVRAERLQEAGAGGEQLTFDAHDQQRARAQRVMDEVADRFGPDAAFSARMLM